MCGSKDNVGLSYYCAGFDSLGSWVLIICNLLFYFKESVLFEKLFLSFGSAKIIKCISYLAWHPTSALMLLTVVCLAAIIVITFIVKIASFFVRNKVFYSSVYFSVIWSSYYLS